jgi:tetratricopeptide (TPR) repeat protein
MAYLLCLLAMSALAELPDATKSAPPVSMPTSPKELSTAPLETVESVIKTERVAARGAEQASAARAAYKLIREKRYKEADERLDGVITWFEIEIKSTGTAGRCFANEKQFQTYAEEHPAEKITWFDLSYSDALGHKAFIAVSEGRLDDAQKTLTRQCEVAPYEIGPHCERGYIFTERRNFVHALASYQAALDLAAKYSPEDAHRPMALRGKGSALIELGRLDEAEQCFKDALALDPGNRLALNELGYIGELRARQKKAAGATPPVPATKPEQ